MAYVDPATVWAPRARIRSVEVLYNSKDKEWSVARIGWDDEEGERIGIRWNGTEDSPGIGSPQSRGKATWFILPQCLEGAVLDEIEKMAYGGPGGLIEKYKEMAGDSEREREAEEWSEGLIGDASSQG